MFIIRFLYCLIEGHAFVDTTATERPYQFCLRCGKIQEPSAYLKRTHRSPEPVRVRIDE